MGRHSVPDDDAPDDVLASSGVASAPSAGVPAAGPAEPVAAGARGGSPEPPALRGSHADLALLRTDSALRARCIAAAAAPFVLYTVGLFVVGRTGIYLLWVWVPIVLAGIGVGAMLDIGHRAALDRVNRAALETVNRAAVEKPDAEDEPA